MPRSPPPGSRTAAALIFTIGTFDLGVPLLVAAMATAGFLGGMIMPSRDMLVRAAAPPGMTGRVFGIVTTGFNIGGSDWSYAGRLAHGPWRAALDLLQLGMLHDDDRAGGPGRRPAVAPAGGWHGFGTGGVDNDGGRTHSDEEQALIELAQRVLPAGSFGNLPATSSSAKVAAAASGTSAATNMWTSCWAPARCSSATATPT